MRKYQHQVSVIYIFSLLFLGILGVQTFLMSNWSLFYSVTHFSYYIISTVKEKCLVSKGKLVPFACGVWDYGWFRSIPHLLKIDTHRVLYEGGCSLHVVYTQDNHPYKKLSNILEEEKYIFHNCDCFLLIYIYYLRGNTLPKK